MAGFHHEANEPDEQENEVTTKRNTRYGLILFAIYLAMYGGFVFLNAFAPAQMESTPFWGVNLAVMYGFLLIIAAFFIALVYGWLCRSEAELSSGKNEGSDQEEAGQ